MNRLSNYFKAQKIVKLYLVQANQSMAKGRGKKALKNLLAAMEEMRVAMNNVASIAFDKRPKK